jgi:hypothetical protein
MHDPAGIACLLLRRIHASDATAQRRSESPTVPRRCLNLRNRPAADAGPRPRLVPLDDPRRSPHVRTSNGAVGGRHLPTFMVGTDRRYADSQIAGEIGRRPPLSGRVRISVHAHIVSTRPSPRHRGVAANRLEPSQPPHSSFL